MLRLRGDAAILAVPLAVDGRNSAVLELVESRAPRAFTGANVTFAEFMARQATQLLSSGDERPRRTTSRARALPDGVVAEAPDVALPAAGPAARPRRTAAPRARARSPATSCATTAESATLEPVAAAAAGDAPPLRGLLHPVADFGPAAEALSVRRPSR